MPVARRSRSRAAAKEWNRARTPDGTMPSGWDIHAQSAIHDAQGRTNRQAANRHRCHEGGTKGERWPRFSALSSLEVCGLLRACGIQSPVKRATFRFYAELGDFLPPFRRGVAFPHEFQGSPSVKDVVESLGVPHTEVDLVLADGESVDFSWILRDGAWVSVYPVFESIDITPLARVRPAPLREVRFVLDGHLGRLARFLRMLGFDARWRADATDEELARVAAAEHRILLTRDTGLLKRRIVTHGYWVREVDPRRQLAEVVHRLDLLRSISPFRRCLRCNELLETVGQEEVAGELPPAVRQRRDAFRRCPSCRRVYWAGSHHRRMERLIADLVKPRTPPWT